MKVALVGLFGAAGALCRYAAAYVALSVVAGIAAAALGYLSARAWLESGRVR